MKSFMLCTDRQYGHFKKLFFIFALGNQDAEKPQN